MTFSDTQKEKLRNQNITRIFMVLIHYAHTVRIISLVTFHFFGKACVSSSKYKFVFYHERHKFNETNILTIGLPYQFPTRVILSW